MSSTRQGFRRIQACPYRDRYEAGFNRAFGRRPMAAVWLNQKPLGCICECS